MIAVLYICTSNASAVSELEPGQSGSLTIAMKPGKYILFCNIPGHYVMGMWAILEITG